MRFQTKYGVRSACVTVHETISPGETRRVPLPFCDWARCAGGRALISKLIDLSTDAGDLEARILVGTVPQTDFFWPVAEALSRHSLHDGPYIQRPQVDEQIYFEVRNNSNSSRTFHVVTVLRLKD